MGVMVPVTFPGVALRLPPAALWNRFAVKKANAPCFARPRRYSRRHTAVASTPRPAMTPQQFIAKWKKADLSERSAYQQHFLDLCELLGQPKPADVDPAGKWFTFEKGVAKTDGGKGFADVWLQDKFGWEYKGKHKNLNAAYQQLLKYRESLENPPLLVVCDLERFEVHTNFTGTVKKV